MGIKKYLSLDKLDLFYEKLKTKMSSDNASTLASAKDYTNQELVDFAGEMNEAIDLLDTAIGSKASQSDLTALQTTVDGKANATHNHAISDVANLQAQLDSKAEVGHTHTVDSALSSTSTNPIQNKVVQSAIKQLQDSKLDKDDLTTIQTGLSTHTADKSNPHGVTASQVGLGNVNNTSDANKPVSTAQATAIADAKKAGTDAQADIDAHITDKSNPHGVTASQIGADPAGSASAVQTNLDVVEDKIDDHIANSDVHFTTEERTKLSNLNNYSHPNSGVTAGTYRSVTVDSQGHVKSGSNPTTLAGYGITDAEKAGAVSTHNISDSAHSDIRSLINELVTKVNNFLDVDDKTKDQLSELISLIEANKTDIESITSGKVNVSDIVDNLVTNLSDKPLSASQGVELKILIDGLQALVNAHEKNTGNPHGVTASQIGLGNVDNTSDENKPVSTAQAKAIADAKEVGTEAKVNLEAHTADKSNPHGITKAQINLGNVDNTSDEDKPVSTLQATAIADAKKAGTDAQASLTTHTGNKANPHGVTKEQIDLGNVPNVTTNNQTPTYTVASANAELKSGETMSTAFGKIAKAVSSLISHLGSKSNPHSVTKSQVGLGNVDNTADANKSVKHATTSDTASTATTLTGLTATVAELNKLDGVTATAAELNYTDGVTSNIQTQLDGKQTTISGAATTITGSNLTASRALISNSSGKVAVSAVTSTELGYLDGVTSSIQTQLDGKQATVTGGASTITGSNLTASRALVSDGNGKVAVSAVTSTELGYLDGVTSAIQTQLDGKATSGHTHSSYVNQNAFSNVTVGTTTIAADSVTDTLTLVAGGNVTITPDTANDKITIAATDTTYGAAGSSLGLVKTGGDVTISSGVITVNDDSHNHVISNVDGLQSALDGKAASGHTHTAADVGALPLNGVGGLHNIKTYTLANFSFSSSVMTMEMIFDAMEDDSIFVSELWKANYPAFTWPADFSNNYVILEIKRNGTGYGTATIYDLVANTKYEQSKYGGVWSGWKKAFYADGSVSMTGGLVFDNTDNYFAITKTRDLGGTPYKLTLGVEANGGSTLEHYTNGVLDGRLLLRSRLCGDELSLAIQKDSVSPAYKIFGEHNTELLKNYVLPLDGSSWMSGPLTVQNNARVLGWTSGDMRAAQFVSMNPNNGDYTTIQMIHGVDISTALSFARAEGGTTTFFGQIFGDHNKPSGEYTGNGSATTRYINIDRMLSGCNAVLIRRSATTASTESFVIAVKSNGGFGRSGTTVKTFTNEQLGVGDKQLIITSADVALNANGVLYKYYAL